MPSAQRKRRCVRPTVPLVVTALLLGALALVEGPALAGIVRGRITGQEKLVPDVYSEAAKVDAHHYTWREPSPTVKADFRVLSGNPSRDLCIAALAKDNAPAHDPILVRITGGHTVPTTIVVAPGTRLSFDNHDPFAHRLYVVGSTSWRAENIESKNHREWGAPNGAARFEFRDELFPSVRTFVVVDPQVMDIAYPGHDGAFALNLPGGDYVLKAYFNGRQVGRAVSVAARDRQLVDLREPVNVGEAPDGKPLP